MELSSQDKEFLELYSDSVYEKPSVTVDAVIFRMIDKDVNNYRKLPQKKMQVYLLKRKYPPFVDAYSVVGTFIDLNKTLTDSMKLCVKNKVGLENFYFEQLFTFGDKQRDPRTRVLSVSYLLLADNRENLFNGEWFDLNIEEKSKKIETLSNGYKIEKIISVNLENSGAKLENTLKVTIEKRDISYNENVEIVSSELAFDHIKLIYFAHSRLKNKLEYTDIVFNLLNEKFTLTELKNCYEEILGEKLLDANFRRKTADMVAPLNEYLSNKGHRPSQLFKHNPNWRNL